MNKRVFLTEPTMELEKQYLSFYEEWKQSGESMVPWVIARDPSDFAEMLRFLSDHAKGTDIPENWVPSSTYWLVDEDRNVVGAVNIRHRLNEKLFCSGGHIGYGIRPTERRKGYASKLLTLSLEKAGELGIERALVVCDAPNVGSMKTILNNGGVPDDDFIEEGGNVINRFWIQL